MPYIFVQTIFVISVLFVPITVQAGELDGKTLHCQPDVKGALPYGLFFSQGEVRRVIIKGYKTTTDYKAKYEFEGLNRIKWYYRMGVQGAWSYLRRDTLRNDGAVCIIVSAKRNYELLNNLISEAKKKNRI